MSKHFSKEYTITLNWKDESSVLLNELFVTQTAYDALNRPTAVTQPDGSVIAYRYDQGGMLQKVLHGSTEYIKNITYNARGQREAIYYGNNTRTAYTYHPENFRLTRLWTTRNAATEALQDLNYTYDAVGNITEIYDAVQGNQYFNNALVSSKATYRYDALYRLVEATGRELYGLVAPDATNMPEGIPVSPNNALQNYTHQYEYDALGNLLEDPWKTYEYADSGANNYLLGHDGRKDLYTYDAHGNLLSMPHLSSMVWDYKDQLQSAGNGTFTSYYQYDVQGNRTRKTVNKGNIVETRYYINGYELYLKEVNGSTEPGRTTVNISDDEKVFVRIEQKAGENKVVRYQYDNHLGSACLELDENAALISYEEYHPFGTTSYHTHSNNAEVSLKQYRYCGKERDADTGLYYYGARYYAAWLCRFTSCDPLKEKYPTWNTYHYCHNNPLNMVDPTGMAASPIYVDGLFMGTDNEGFTGEIITMTLEQYNKLSLQQKDQITMGTMKHEDAMKLGETLGQKIDRIPSRGKVMKDTHGRDDWTNVSRDVQLVNRIINHVVSKTENMQGYEPFRLHNKSVSSVYDNNSMIPQDRIYGVANEAIHGENALAHTGSNKVTYELQSWGNVEMAGKVFKPTVENLQNTYVHEAGGHFFKKWGDKTHNHSKAYKSQMEHPSFKGTTPLFKQHIKEEYHEFKKKNN